MNTASGKSKEGDGPPHWVASHPAVWCERLLGNGAVCVRHPSYPFWGRVDAASPLAGLRDLANRYVVEVQQLAGISDAVQQALQDDTREEFGWLPVTWGPGELQPMPGSAAGAELERHRGGSFWVARRMPGGVVDRTLVMLAGYRLGNKTRSAGGEVGLRVVIHLGAAKQDGQALARITGMSSSRLPSGFGAAKPLDPMDEGLRRDIAALATTLSYTDAAIDGMAFVDPAKDQSLRVFLSCARAAADGSLRNFRLVADFPQGAEPIVREQVERVSHAVTPVFAHDPASCPPAGRPIQSRRPTRKDEVLDEFRLDTAGIPYKLEHASGAMQVRQTPLGNGKADAKKVQEIVPGDLPLRGDQLAAAHAFQRGDELLQRMLAYGLLPQDYFKHAKLPLLLRHRAPLKGARDGVSVNAQVRPGDIGSGIYPPEADGPPPPVEVSFGWAELAHRSRQPNDVPRLRAQPLGLAADARWAWHEFGHVLNFASLGELEFRFAHSAGDALAAIVADPGSKRRGAERGLTFPWVFAPRRHDRSAIKGWCWCGRRNLPRLLPAQAGALRGPHLGYFEEQLMSSSLFRLYRCIGGDSPRMTTRRRASDYCVYLLMRAIHKLGQEAVVPAATIDHLVSALIDADIATGEWVIQATWPLGAAPRTVRRIGGCVHKVIRWAFEQQGLYATDDPARTVEGPGRPPAVDVYIQDRRAARDGGYHPVPLLVNDLPTPQWHASDEGISLDQGQVVVKVRNRGRQSAQQVTVQCWRLLAGQSPDKPASWVVLPPGSAQPQPVDTQVPTAFTFPAVDGGGVPLLRPFAVRASASCPEDLSNLDPLTQFPLGGLVVPRADLVANDNNLGYRIL